MIYQRNLAWWDENSNESAMTIRDQEMTMSVFSTNACPAHRVIPPQSSKHASTLAHPRLTNALNIRQCPLRLESHSITSTRFLRNLEKNFPEVFALPSLFNVSPCDFIGDPRQRRRRFDARGLCSSEWGDTGWVWILCTIRACATIYKNYRLERPYESNLKRLCDRLNKHLPETSLDGVITANIVASFTDQVHPAAARGSGHILNPKGDSRNLISPS